MFEARHISIAIDRSPADIYAFAANPENLPKWAAGLSGATIVRLGDTWICQSPMGKVGVKFADRNHFGVMDHDVTLPSGEVSHNPFRVVKNDRGSEVIFTLFKLPRMSSPDFEKDAQLIASDLKTLKSILEVR